MKKGKILGLFILGLLVIAFLASVITAAEVNGQTNILNEAGNSIKAFFASSSFFSDEANKAGFSKFLLIMLLVLIIYSASDMIPFISGAGEGIKWTVAIIIGLLGFMFVSPENVKFILTNYEALGVTITTIIPLLVILGFTVKLQKDHPTTAVFVNPLVLILFSLYCFMKWITIYWTPGEVPELAYLYPIALILTIIWLFINGTIARWWNKKEIEAQAETGANFVERAAKGAGVLAGALDQMAKEAEASKKTKR